jgi:hypothetical protein
LQDLTTELQDLTPELEREPCRSPRNAVTLHVCLAGSLRKRSEAAPDRDERIAELQSEVEQLVQAHVAEAMRRVVTGLNALGHQLVEEARDENGGICFETDKGAPGLYYYLCYDTTVSAGWRPRASPPGYSVKPSY